MNLRLYDGLGLAQGLECLCRFIWSRSRLALGNRRAETAQNLFRLEFVNIH
jgi:hypothetical protein